MPSRIELEQRARVVGINPASYPNDSRLEQRLLYAERNAATVAGTLQSTTLTSNATAPSNGDQILLGVTRTYTYVTALTEALASVTLTGSNAANATNGSTLTIGGTTYIFVTTLGAAQNQVLIGGSADATLTNLVDAITGGGTAGTNYSNGTPTNTQVTATGPTSHVVTITALVVGIFANGITVGTTEPTYTLGGTTLSGGVDPIANQILIGVNAAAALTNTKSAINGTTGMGTTYSSGTVASLHAAATTLTTTTLLITANTQSSAQTINTTAPVGSTLSFTGTTMSGNVQPVIVAPTDSVNGQEGQAAV